MQFDCNSADAAAFLQNADMCIELSLRPKKLICEIEKSTNKEAMERLKFSKKHNISAYFT